jgi:N-acetyltransferase 10
MLRGLGGENAAEAKGWMSDFALDFRKRFIALLSFKFRDFPSVTALSMLEAANAAEVGKDKSTGELTLYAISGDLR